MTYTYNEKLPEGHNENEHDPEEFEHDNGEECRARGCAIHDEHWQDDFAYMSESRLPVPADAPRTDTMAKLVSGLEDVPIYRFAVVYVNAENGTVQLATNPGMTETASINLLAKAIAILSYQEAQVEREAQQMVAGAMAGALTKAMVTGQYNGPDLSQLLGGMPTGPIQEDEEIPSAKNNMREGYL